MSLSFAPESVDEMRARFAKALASTHLVNSQGCFGAPPSGDRAHVFDFNESEFAARLIVSIDQDVSQAEPATYLHASVSFGRGSPAPLAPFWITRTMILLKMAGGEAIPESLPIAKFGFTGLMTGGQGFTGRVFHLTTPWPFENDGGES